MGWKTKGFAWRMTSASGENQRGLATFKNQEWFWSLLPKLPFTYCFDSEWDWKKGNMDSTEVPQVPDSLTVSRLGGGGRMNGGSKNLLCKLVIRRSLKEGKQRVTRGDNEVAHRSLQKVISVERQRGGVKSVTINSDSLAATGWRPCEVCFTNTFPAIRTPTFILWGHMRNIQLI